MNPENLNNNNEESSKETPEQEEMSRQLRGMATGAEKQEKGELPDPKQEILDYLKQRIGNTENSLPMAEEHRSTYESMGEDATWDKIYLRKAEDNVFPDDFYKDILWESKRGNTNTPLDEADYQAHKEEYDNSKRESEERTARAKRMLEYMDKFRGSK